MLEVGEEHQEQLEGVEGEGHRPLVGVADPGLLEEVERHPGLEEVVGHRDWEEEAVEEPPHLLVAEGEEDRRFSGEGERLNVRLETEQQGEEEVHPATGQVVPIDHGLMVVAEGLMMTTVGVGERSHQPAHRSVSPLR